MVFQFLDLHQRLQLTLQKSYSVPGLAPNSFPEDISPFLCTVSLSWKRKTACFQLLRWLLPGTCGCSVCTILLLHPESPRGTYPGPAVHDKQDTDLYTGTTASHLWFLHLDCSHKWTCKCDFRHPLIPPLCWRNFRENVLFRLWVILSCFQMSDPISVLLP